MIDYDAKGWLRVFLSIRGTVIPRIAARVVFLAVLTVSLLIIREWVPGAAARFMSLKPLGHTLIGVALGLMIVFRTNSSYDRYWEGRKLWGGLVNTTRNLVRGAAVYTGEVRELAQFVSAYVLALKRHLRSDRDLEEIRALLPPTVFEQVAAAANPPNMLAYHMSTWIHARMGEGRYDSILAQGLESQVRILLDLQGGCERILRTPLPFAYAVHNIQLLMLYLVSLPFVLVGEIGWVSVPTVMAVSFGLIGIEEMGVEIEDPFGDDPNDLPVEAICATIARDVMALAEAPKVSGREQA